MPRAATVSRVVPAPAADVRTGCGEASLARSDVGFDTELGWVDLRNDIDVAYTDALPLLVT